jgi:hypothetical protein
MMAIETLYTKYPFSGNRQISSWLARIDIKAGRQWVRRLMRQPDLQAVSRRPQTSQPHPAHLICPYLLRGTGDHAAKQGLVFGHHLHTGPPGVSLPRRHHRLGNQKSSLVAGVELYRPSEKLLKP